MITVGKIFLRVPDPPDIQNNSHKNKSSRRTHRIQRTNPDGIVIITYSEFGFSTMTVS